MPWKSFLVNSEYCVFRIDESGGRFGKSLGCHATKEKANRQVAALNIAENKNMGLPTNRRGMNTAETLAVVEQAGKYSKEESNYIEPSPNSHIACGTCRFFLRDEDSEVGGCQVVKGGIAWFASSDFYISAESESRVSFAGANAYEGDEEKKETNMDEKDEVKETAETILEAEKFDAVEKEEKQMTVAFTMADLDQAEERAEKQGEMRREVGRRRRVENMVMSLAPESEQLSLLTKLADEFKTRMSGMNKKQRPMKTEGGTAFPKSDFAFTPSDKPSTWKLRLAEGSPGNITVKQLGRAAAAFSSGGFRGNKVQLPSSAVASAKSKIRGAYRKLGVKPADIPDSVKARSTFLITKGEDGIYRFITTYSNNIRDHDNPPEIISSKSHEAFVNLVDTGKVPLPQLWLWHMPELHMGEVTTVAYDKDNGIAVAAGFFFKEANPIAEIIMTSDDEWGVSHGMPSDSVVRNKEDRTVIEQHITKEISPLPRYAAANKWADFQVLKEVSMTLKEEKIAQMKENGINDSMIDAVLDRNGEVSEKADELELDRKEETPVKEVETEAPAEEKEIKAEAEVEAEVKEETPQPAFTKEQATQLKDVFDAFRVAVIDEMKELIKPLEEKLDAKEVSRDERVKEMIVNTPIASLSDMLFPTNLKSATEAEETEIDGRSSLGKDGPKTTKESAPKIVNTGNPQTDGIVNAIFAPPVEQEA